MMVVSILNKCIAIIMKKIINYYISIILLYTYFVNRNNSSSLPRFWDNSMGKRVRKNKQ